VLFNSYEFALFFVVVLAVHRTLSSHRARLRLLLIASGVFYVSHSGVYLLLLAASVVGDWLLGNAIAARPHKARAFLIASIVLNLGVLSLFKYADFVLGTLATLGAPVPRTLGLPLPLGISFYTFMSLSYTIDVYWKRCPPEPSLERYSVFLGFFPHLMAGPILRANDFLPQLRTGDEDERRRSAFGVNRILLGLFKKAVLADFLGRLVGPVFADPAAYDGASNLIVLYLYSFQVYFDFSAYSDIAIGAAALLGYQLPDNFDAPFLAGNFRLLWRRWHMTLSRWLRDYLYIPLGGSRRGTFRTCVNLLITATLCGLWHGAGWGYVLWGVILGALLVVSRLRHGERVADVRERRFSWSAVIVFHGFVLSMALFRSTSIANAGEMLRRLTTLPACGWRALPALALSPVLLAVYAPLTRLRRRLEQLSPEREGEAIAYGCALALAATLTIVFASPQAEFIYFRF
jgi:alginate O-acetyltransferase complex protein AlgI